MSSFTYWCELSFDLVLRGGLFLSKDSSGKSSLKVTTGKLAGMHCPHLDEALRCRLFGQPQRPSVCASLAPSAEMCGGTREHALYFLSRLEQATRP